MDEVIFVLWAALAAALIPYSTLGHSAERAPAACGARISQVYYSARFQWQGEKRLVIGEAQKPGATPAVVAQIWSGKTCEAVCSPASLEKDDAAHPVSMDMECRSAGFTAASTPATLLWSARSGNAPALRFGTWLSGYRQAPVRVTYDAYSKAGATRQIAAN